MQLRKIALCVDTWWSEENHFAWNFTRKRLLQEGTELCRNDQLYVVHVSSKAKEGETWDKGTAVMADVRTEMSHYDHSIVELQGDVVNSIVQFLTDEGIHIAILSLKDQNRVRKTLSTGTATQLLSKGPCACVVVTPRFSAGDHLRIQAKLQPDAIVTNSAMEFRRRVALLLNSSLWDSALTHYAANNVILPGDRVVLVRCLHENLNKKPTEQLQVERDYLRELGWHKFKRTTVTLAVEVIKSQPRVLNEFIEEKGIDLLIMTKTDSNKIKQSIKKDMGSFQTSPHRCQCPFMVVPTEVLQSCDRIAPQSSIPSSAFREPPSSPFKTNQITSPGLFKRKNWSNALRGRPFRFFSQNNRRCQSLDCADNNQSLHTFDYVCHQDSIELSSSAVAADLENIQPVATETPSRENLIAGISSEAVPLPVTPSITNNGERQRRAAVVRRLQKKLMEKEKEVAHLKQRIRHLQHI